MDQTAELIEQVSKIRHGFLDIQKTANELVARKTAQECLEIARKLYASDIYQARSLATFIFGRLSAKSATALDFLKNIVSRDNDWRVQEILAKAFDRYCADVGYEHALPTIKGWLSDPSPNVRRAVTEGLRIWTGRPYFSDHPEEAIGFLSRLRDDESEYVRRSVGNALRDISKKHGELVEKELSQWDLTDKRIRQTHKPANRHLEKRAGQQGKLGPGQKASD